MEKSDSLNMKLHYSIVLAYRSAQRASNEIFREKGLTAAQFSVLELLDADGEITIQQIIDALGSSSGNITVVVRNLEQLGLISRRENPEDRRSFLIDITEDGKKLTADILPRHSADMKGFFSKLTAEEKQTAAGILEKLR